MWGDIRRYARHALVSITDVAIAIPICSRFYEIESKGRQMSVAKQTWFRENLNILHMVFFAPDGNGRTANRQKKSVMAVSRKGDIGAAIVYCWRIHHPKKVDFLRPQYESVRAL